MHGKQSVKTKFRSNIEEIAETLVDAFGLCHKRNILELSNPLLRWLDFRLRFLDPTPRKLVLSSQFPKAVPAKVKKAADDFFDRVEAGLDLNPFQGKGLILHHDTSGGQRGKRTDLLWADWRIYHFHLTDMEIPTGNYFSNRSDWLLFAMVDSTIFACVDIRQHQEKEVFSNPDLMRIVAESWPDYIAQFELKGIHAPETSLSAEEYARARKGGVWCPIPLDGKVYIGPGEGITTASTASIVTSAEHEVMRYISVLAEILDNSADEVLPDWKDQENRNIIDLRLCITPRGVAIVAENDRDKAWISLGDTSQATDCLARLSTFFAPDWALKRIFCE